MLWATSTLALSVSVPWRMYASSRRSTRPGPMGIVGGLRSQAWRPVISSVDLTRSPAAGKVGACRYRAVTSALFSSAVSSGVRGNQ